MRYKGDGQLIFLNLHKIVLKMPNQSVSACICLADNQLVFSFVNIFIIILLPMLLWLTMLSLLYAASPASFSLSISNKTINALNSYNINIVRDSNTQISQIQLTLPNGTIGADLSTSTIKINGTLPTSYVVQSGLVSFNPTTAINFIITIQNVKNPSFNLILNSTNTWAIIDSANITLTTSVQITKGALKSCNIQFKPGVGVLGTGTVIFTTTNPISTTNSRVLISFPGTFWTQSTNNTGLIVKNGVANVLQIPTVLITFANGTSSAPVFSFNYTNTIINISINSQIASGSAITINLSNINTPPFQTTDTLIKASSFSNYGAVDDILFCSISQTNINQYYAVFSGSTTVNTILQNPIATITTPIANSIITMSSVNISSYPTDELFTSSNFTMIGPIDTISCQNGKCVPTTSSSSAINQLFNISFNRQLKFPRSAESMYINLIFLMSSKSYMKIAIKVQPIPGNLIDSSIQFSQKKIGEQSTALLSFTTYNNSVDNPVGISLKTPKGMILLNTASCTTNLSDLTFVSVNRVNQTLIVCRFSLGSVFINKQIYVTISGIINGPSTGPIGPFVISSLLKPDNVNSIVQTSIIPTYSSLQTGIVSNYSILCSNDTVNAVTNCSLSYTMITNYVNIGTKITIGVPPSMSIASTIVNLTVDGTPYNELVGNIVGTNITFTMPVVAIRGSNIILIMQLRNPSITGKTTSFSFYDSTPQGYQISKIESNLQVQISTPQWMPFSVYPSDPTTGVTSDYNIQFKPTVGYSPNSILTLSFQTSILDSVCSSNCTCIIQNSSTLNMQFSSALLANNLYSCKIQNIKNPRTNKPQTVTILSRAGGQKVNQGAMTLIMSNLNNIIVTDPNSNNKQYNSPAPINLTIAPYSLLGITDYLIVSLDSNFYSRSVNVVDCIQNSFYTCEQVTTSSTLNVKVSFKSIPSASFSFSLIGYKTGNVGNSGTIQITSCDSENYKIDKSSSFVFVPTCFGGCKTCDSSNFSFCKSCYNADEGAFAIYLINNVCTNNCSSVSQFYYNAGDQCQQCNSSCSSCTSATSCTSCRTNFYLYSNWSCIQTCPDNYYHFPGSIVGTQGTMNFMYCFICSSQCSRCVDYSHSCTACTNTSLVLYQNTCVQNCPYGFYLSLKTCLVCDQSCNGCTGGSSFNCTLCANTFIRTSFNQCLSTCPLGTVFNSATQTCQCEQGCLYCEGSIYNCSVCQATYTLSDGRCLNECPNGTFKSGEICKQCSVQCKDCRQTGCIDCGSSYIYNGTCYTDCTTLGSGFTNNLQLKTCESGFTCGVGYILINGLCSKGDSGKVIGAGVSFGSMGIISTSVVIISKVMSPTTSLSFSGMSLMSSQQILAIISLLATKTSDSSNISRRLLQQVSQIGSGTACLIAALILTYVLNIIHIWMFCKYIDTDTHFYRNKRKNVNKIIDKIIFVFASLTNFKFYQIVFSKLCNVGVLRSRLSSVSLLFPLKLLNAASALISLLSIVGSAISLSEFASQPSFALSIITLILSVFSIFLTLLTFIRDDNFFNAEDGVYSDDGSAVKSVEYIEAGQHEFSTLQKKNKNKNKNKVAPLFETQYNLADDLPYEKGDLPLQKKVTIFNRETVGNAANESAIYLESSKDLEDSQNVQVNEFDQIIYAQQDKQKSIPYSKTQNLHKSLEDSKGKLIKGTERNSKNILEVRNLGQEPDNAVVIDLNNLSSQYKNINKQTQGRRKEISSQLKLRPPKNKISNLGLSQSISQIYGDKGQKPSNTFSESSSNENRVNRQKKQKKKNFNIESRFFTSEEFGQIQPDFQYDDVSPSAFNLQNQRFESQNGGNKNSLFALKSFQLKDLRRE